MSNRTRMERRRQAEEEKKIVREPEKKLEQSDRMNSLVIEQGTGSVPPPIPPMKPLKKKRKKRKKLRRVGLVVLVLLILSGIAYGKGYAKARGEKGTPSMNIGNFAGKKADKGIVNVLLLGSDSRGEDQGRSDSIMIAHYDKRHKQPKLVSIMRDTFVGIPVDGGLEYNKINAAYSYGGPELVRQSIEQTFGVPIEYYAVVNFESFPKIIDTLAPGGLKIDAEKELSVDGVTIHPGEQKMSGEEALQYARFRKDEEGDFGRVRRQQQVMTALMKQGLNPLNAWRLPETIGAVSGYTQTNLPTSFYFGTGSSYLFSRHKPLEILTIPVEGSWSNGYYDYAGSVLEIDEQMNREAITTFFKK